MRYTSLFIFAGLILTGLGCGRPVADFAMSTESDNPTAPSTVYFDNESTKADSFYWYFGDGQTSTQINPIHEYPVSGNYQIQLVAKNKQRTDTATRRLVIDAPLDCLVEIMTPYGDMLVRLSNATPKHRDNFVKLVEIGFYDSLLFHRVVEGFMIQGGDPNSRNPKQGMQLGSGGPGYDIPAEFVDTLIHRKGALAAARMPDSSNPEKRSSGSQFYIVDGMEVTSEELDQLEIEKNIRYSEKQRDLYLKYGGAPSLDREYTIFGQVIEGLEVIDKIASQPTEPNDRPKENIPMTIRLVK